MFATSLSCEFAAFGQVVWIESQVRRGCVVGVHHTSLRILNMEMCLSF